MISDEWLWFWRVDPIPNLFHVITYLLETGPKIANRKWKY